MPKAPDTKEAEHCRCGMQDLSWGHTRGTLPRSQGPPDAEGDGSRGVPSKGVPAGAGRRAPGAASPLLSPAHGQVQPASVTAFLL